MLTHIHPKLPMRDKIVTQDYYVNQLGFQNIGITDYDGYLMLKKDEVEIHFFEFQELDIKENYGQIYLRTNNIEELYEDLLNQNVQIHPNAPLQIKPWGQKEFSLLDPDYNLLTFGQSI
ncbi:MAG: VOC family protein [Flavobacteriia bacterium]|nr:VOC family protein [Flavobacteriia bacterium]MBH2023176.1 VOC family protein [Flavobacteriales bacterium]